MEEEDMEVVIKAVVVGNGAVGKSSMIQRYCNGVYTDGYKKTIGVDFLEKKMELDGEQINLMLWDTAGQEEYDAITRAYYRGAQVCVLAFSTVDRASFEAVESWKSKVEAVCGSIVMILVQNKIDLLEEAKVSVEEVEGLAKRLKLHLFRTSVKMNFNVEPAFEYLIRKFLENKKKETGVNNASSQPQQHSTLAAFFGDETKNTSSSNISRQPNGGSFQINPSKTKLSKKRFCSIL